MVVRGWQGKDSSLQRKLLESDFTLTIGNQETEVAMRMNCAAYEGDFYLLQRLIASGADPNKTDYDGRSPLVWMNSMHPTYSHMNANYSVICRIPSKLIWLYTWLKLVLGVTLTLVEALQVTLKLVHEL